MEVVEPVLLLRRRRGRGMISMTGHDSFLGSGNVNEMGVTALQEKPKCHI